jgi:uncharacterized membrane protein
MIVLLLAAARVVAIDGGSRSVVIVSFGSLLISRWTMIALSTAILTEIIAWMRPGATQPFPLAQQRIAQILPAAPPIGGMAPVVQLQYAAPAAGAPAAIDAMGVVFSGIGTLLYLFTAVTVLNGPAIALAWALWAGGLALLAHPGRRLAYLPHAAALIGLIVLRWGLWDQALPILAGWHSAHGVLMPLVNLPCLVGGILIPEIAGLLVQLRRAGHDRLALRRGLQVALGGVVLALVNFQTLYAVDWFCAHIAQPASPAMAKQVALSILWGVCGFVGVIAGFRRDFAALRYAALSLLGFTLVKILIVDMADVRAVWRILSFIAVGTLLLGVSYIYHQHIAVRDPAPPGRSAA